MKNQTVKLKDIVKGDYDYNESINTLRTNIQFCGSNVKKIMFTSAFPDEGKSEVAMSLACSLAQIGKKVLLVDADIRKSVLAAKSQFRYDEISGLSQYLSGQKKLGEIIYDVEGMDCFSVIFAGPYSPDPAGLLEDEAFARVFIYLSQLYDYIIVDTPPMANLIDGAIIAQHCDGAVMVIESGAASYRLEQKVKRQLEVAGCRILGVVLNKVDEKKQGYYGKYGKYGKYGHYSQYGQYSPDEKNGSAKQEDRKRGTMDRGTTDRGTTDRGTADRGTVGRETTGRETADRGIAGQETTDRGTADRETVGQKTAVRENCGPENRELENREPEKTVCGSDGINKE